MTRTRSQETSLFYLHTPCSSAIGMNHTCLPSRSWYSFTDPEQYYYECSMSSRNLVLLGPTNSDNIASLKNAPSIDGYEANWGKYVPCCNFEELFNKLLDQNLDADNFQNFTASSLYKDTSLEKKSSRFDQ